MKKIYVFIIVLTLGIVTLGLIYKEGTLPVNKGSKETKIFVIEKGEALNSIVKRLSNEGFIRNRVVFFMMIKRMGIDKKIQAGDFRLSPSMDANEIAQTLTHGTLDIWVTIIEGLRKEEVAQIISKEFDIPEIEFIKNAPEEYVFPDTYLIPRTATAGSIVETLTNTFQTKYTPDLRNRTKKLGLTTDQAVVLASLVEREARIDSDRQQVASILLKRLEEDWPLQLDATIQYAIGYRTNEKTWWSKEITEEDLAINSFYNTYKNKGLPPGPICNPSLSALEAVANANSSTPYWYYISDTTGKMHYSRTLEEHEANVEKYLR